MNYLYGKKGKSKKTEVFIILKKQEKHFPKNQRPLLIYYFYIYNRKIIY